MTDLSTSELEDRRKKERERKRNYRLRMRKDPHALERFAKERARRKRLPQRMQSPSQFTYAERVRPVWEAIWGVPLPERFQARLG